MPTLQNNQDNDKKYLSEKTQNGPRNGTMSGKLNKVQSLPRHWQNLKSTLEVELKCTLEQKFLEIFQKSQIILIFNARDTDMKWYKMPF